MAPSWSSRSTAPVAIRPRPAPSERTSTRRVISRAAPAPSRRLGGARGLHPVAELVARDAVVAAEVVAEADVVVVDDLDLPGVQVGVELEPRRRGVARGERLARLLAGDLDDAVARVDVAVDADVLGDEDQHAADPLVRLDLDTLLSVQSRSRRSMRWSPMPNS